MTLLGHERSTAGAEEAVPRVRRRAVVGAVAWGVMLVLFLTSVYFALPSNVVALRGEQPLRTFFTRLLPQGWGFFTKPPDSPEVSPFLVEDGVIRHVSRFPNSKAENLFGASREQRSQGPEMANLSHLAREWVTCAEVDGDCRVAAVETLEPTPVSSTAPVPTLCGQVVLVETVPVPWVFREDYRGWRIDSRATLLEVECAR